jgi:CRP-like cAMP-binding protein
MLNMQLVLAPVFRKLDADTRQSIAVHMQQHRIKAGEVLFRENDATCDVYLVRRGKVAIDLNIDGRDRQLKTVGSNAVLGEIDVAVRGRRTATARAESDCELMKLAGAAYQRLYHEHHELKSVLEARKRTLLEETRHFIRQLNIVDGDKTCALLLKDIMD